MNDQEQNQYLWSYQGEVFPSELLELIVICLN